MNGHSHSAFCVLRSAICVRRRLAAQAVVEYAIVFPLQLLLTLLIIQLAHIFVAKQVLEYGAFCGARAKLVGLPDGDAKKAVYIPVSAVAGPSGVTTADGITLPGWGTLRHSGAAEQKTTLLFRTDELRSGERYVSCELEHEYELRVPVANTVVYSLGDVALGLDTTEEIGNTPHLKLRAKCLLAKPWDN